MTDVVDLAKARLEMKVRRGYLNWVSQFSEEFDASTRISDLSTETLTFLAMGRERNSFYLYDLIMNLQGQGSGFEFHELGTRDKMLVTDHYLFLLDRIRFEYMKRLGWLESYPGEEFPLADLIIHFNRLLPGLQTKVPILDRDHPAYTRFCNMNQFEKEELIRKLLLEALKELQDHSTTL